MAGGAVMEDFDNDGLLDLADDRASIPTEPMAYYRNTGDGTFEDRTESAGLTEQLGGKNLVQTDLQQRRPHGPVHLAGRVAALLRSGSRCCGTTATARSPTSRKQAGLLDPVNSTYSSLGRLRQRRLARRLHPLRAARPTACITTAETGPSRKSAPRPASQGDARSFCKGANWIDFDNDDYPDLFVDNLKGDARLYHNNRNGTFTDVTKSMGIDGPEIGFSCWAWDYDNDGWLDIFATCYDYTLEDVVKGLLGPAAHADHRTGSSTT